jgi:hypothetical protein
VEHALLDLAEPGAEVAGQEELDAVDLHLCVFVWSFGRVGVVSEGGWLLSVDGCRWKGSIH